MTESYHAMNATAVVLIVLSIVLAFCGPEAYGRNRRRFYIAAFSCLITGAVLFIASAWTAVLT